MSTPTGPSSTSESSHIEYALRYGNDLEEYGSNLSEALADREYARKMSNRGNDAYDNCVLLQRHVTITRTAWCEPEASQKDRSVNGGALETAPSGPADGLHGCSPTEDACTDQTACHRCPRGER